MSWDPFWISQHPIWMSWIQIFDLDEFSILDVPFSKMETFDPSAFIWMFFDVLTCSGCGRALNRDSW
jgi:hypothetical protein